MRERKTRREQLVERLERTAQKGKEGIRGVIMYPSEASKLEREFITVVNRGEVEKDKIKVDLWWPEQNVLGAQQQKPNCLLVQLRKLMP